MADPDSVMERSLEREGASVRMRRLVEEADGLDDLRHCGRMVYYREIQPDYPDETPPEPPRRCPLPKRLERKGREAERRAQKVRSRRQQPARVPNR
jgi:hypothetical protein